MSLNSSNSNPTDTSMMRPKGSHRGWILLFTLPLWVLLSFVAAQLLVSGLVQVLDLASVSLSAVNPNVLNTSFAALIYLLTLLIAIGVPWIANKKYRLSLDDIGLGRLPTWTDIWMTPVGLIVYFILTTVLIAAATSLFPSFDVKEVQDTGFADLNFRYEYIVAFITLVVIAPIAEEILFRGYLFGKLLKVVPIWIAVLATSLLFGFVHGAWNVAIDTFALSIILCVLRLTTGSLWAPIMLHMTKNGIAFYLLFINPSLLTTLG